MYQWSTYFDEEIPHIGGRFSRCFQEYNLVLLRIHLRFFDLDFALTLHVCLIARQCYHYVGVAPTLQLLHPRLGAVERVLLRDVIYNNGRGGTAIVHRCQAPISFWKVYRWEKKKTRLVQNFHLALPCPIFRILPLRLPMRLFESRKRLKERVRQRLFKSYFFVSWSTSNCWFLKFEKFISHKSYYQAGLTNLSERKKRLNFHEIVKLFQSDRTIA